MQLLSTELIRVALLIPYKWVFGPSYSTLGVQCLRVGLSCCCVAKSLKLEDSHVLWTPGALLRFGMNL